MVEPTDTESRGLAVNKAVCEEKQTFKKKKKKGIQEAFATSATTTDSEPIIIWDTIDPKMDLQFSGAK